MKKYRFTKQQEIIYNVILENKIHPTIGEIYLLTKKLDPNIGQATVYRNVNKLSNMGLIKKIVNDADNQIRYDGNINNHMHLYCTDCQKMFDIFERPDIFDIIKKSINCEVGDIEILINGKCQNCMKKN